MIRKGSVKINNDIMILLNVLQILMYQIIPLLYGIYCLNIVAMD